MLRAVARRLGSADPQSEAVYRAFFAEVEARVRGALGVPREFLFGDRARAVGAALPALPAAVVGRQAVAGMRPKPGAAAEAVPGEPAPENALHSAAEHSHVRE